MSNAIVLEDTVEFFNILKSATNIQMHQVKRMNSYGLIGEYYTKNGTPLTIQCVVYPDRTEIKIKNNCTQQCIYQKAYITNSDKRALTKSAETTIENLKKGKIQGKPTGAMGFILYTIETL